MPFEDPNANVPTIEEAIDREPLAIHPETPIPEVVALMSRGREVGSLQNATSTPKRYSCALVTATDRTVLGIFTERDIVRLTASGHSLADLPISSVMSCPVITLSETDLQDIFAALFLFRRYRIRHLTIVDEFDRWVGIVTPDSIRRSMRPSNLLKLRRVSEVMTSPVVCASLSTPIIDVARRMAERHVSCVVATTAEIDGRFLPVGIITERDIVQFQALELNFDNTPLETVMSAPLFLLKPEDSLWVAHQEMQKRHVRRMVVSWDWGYQLGIITQTSLLRIFDPLEMYGVVETLQRTVLQLQHNRSMPSGATLPCPSPSTRPRATLSTLHLCLEQLAGYPELNTPECRRSIERVLKELQVLEREIEKYADLPDCSSQSSV
ncbi:MAG: CBS domain-containing protein [Cyanobacteria bacterium SID2]|nr:CBS domain-containing protein [Cyanobacteria bacterium SID2]MBP0004447.1 CBS domain-containing protein [Cyanobacteria bacterium SBC]